MIKEMKGEDSVEAETSMANTHFLVAQHYAQGQLTREWTTENVTEVVKNSNNREKRRRYRDWQRIKKCEEGGRV